MFFWRKKNNQEQQDREAAEDKIVHHPSEPDLEPVQDADPQIDPEFTKHELNETETEVIEELEEIPSPASRPVDTEVHHESGGGWFSRLSDGLSKSSGKIGLGLGDIFLKGKPDEASLAQLEDLLIEADLGPKTAAALVDKMRERKFDKGDTLAEVQRALVEEITKILSKTVRPLNVAKPEKGPRTYLVCGVNGVGKTTTIGKLAYQLHFKQHKKVMIAAGDTFRAAAIEQLQIWADRTKCPLIARDIGADAASVAFESYEVALKDGMDVLMIDTAGRLHNKANLMAELEKIIRVLQKYGEDIPHEVLLVLDATTGQNAISQVETFNQIVKVTGLVVTKLDGSAKGGVVVALADKFGLPIFAVGVGEDIEDLQPFKPESFAQALVGLSA
ncbi:MAG: signal recognition particle-docking protein FtsY [Alphaproteobacteria bacterium]|nr:signal recognition particle-docking protein FtsY [Alphaproteobacteria bacterium]